MQKRFREKIQLIEHYQSINFTSLNPLVMLLSIIKLYCETLYATSTSYLDN